MKSTEFYKAQAKKAQRRAAELTRTLTLARDIMWPGGDEDHEWDSSTLEDLALVLRPRKRGAR
jgi:hypothetical protein